MKSLKLAGLVAGAAAVLALAAVALALNSGVQTWAVRRALSGQPGLTIEVGRVDAGFSTAQVSQLRLVRDGLTISAGSVTTRHSAWAYLTGRRLDVDELAVKDLAIDLAPPPPAPRSAAGSPGTPAAGSAPARAPAAPAKSSAPATPAAKAGSTFEGLLTQARLPVEVRLGQLTVDGKARLPERQEVVFSLQAAGIQTGRTGRLEWTVDYADGKADAPLQALRSTGTLQLRLGQDRRIDQVDLESLSAALGPNLPKDQVKITVQAAQPKAAGDEDYTVSASLVRGGKTETVLTASARFAAAQREIAGTWEVALRSEQLAALLAGFGLPELAATGSGKFRLKPETAAASASGTLRASVAQLQKLSPALGAVGAVQVTSSFDGNVDGTAATLNAFELEVSEATGRRFARLHLQQKASYRLEDRHVTLADPKAEAARLTLDALPLAWAQPLAKPMTIEQGDLSLTLAVEAEPDGTRLRARAVEPLALRSVTVRDARKQPVVENVTLSLRPSLDYSTQRIRAQLSDLRLEMATGDSLAGTVTAEVTSLAAKPATAFRAQLQARLVSLVRPFLAFDPGTLAAAVEVEGRHEGDALQLAKATASVQREGGALLAAVEALQAITADLKARTFVVANPAAAAARVRVGEIPLAWAEPYVVGSKLAGMFGGTTLEVTMRSVEDLSVAATAPLAFRAVSASLQGKPQAQDLDLSAALSATRRKDAVAFELSRLEVKQGAATLASLTVSGETRLGSSTAATVKGQLEADAAALLRQPALAPFATLAQGRVATAFEANLGDTKQARVVVSAKGLVAKAGHAALGDVEVTMTASLKPDGSGSFSVPLTVVNGGRKSDLAVDGSFGKAADQAAWVFNGKVASANLVADDLQALAALAPAAPAEPAKPTGAPRAPAPAPRAAPGTVSAPPARDAQPFWHGITGRAELDLKRVLSGQDYTIRGIRGGATLTPTRLALDRLEGSFRDNPFKLAATVNFAPAAAQPYSLAGVVEVSGVEVGELLRAANPREKPMLESTVKVSAKLSGNGGTLPDLIERSYGTFSVSGGKGVLRALGRKGETVGAASQLLGLAGALAGSANTVALGRLGSELEEMQFDTFALNVERDAALNLKFTAIEFLSPTKRLAGTGTMNYVPGATADNWPFQFEFKLAGKDFMAQLLNEARVLSGTKDDKGYYPMAMTFPVSGTANQVSNGLWKILAGTAARAGLEGFLRR